MRKEKEHAEMFSLWALLHDVGSLLLDARNVELQPYGLSMMRVALLHVVKTMGEDATPTEISRWVLRKPHSVLSMLDTLERMGLLKKTKDTKRKNLVRIKLTEKGEKAYEQSKKRTLIYRIMSSLSEEKCEQLRVHLLTLRRKGLKELGIDPVKYRFRW